MLWMFTRARPVLLPTRPTNPAFLCVARQHHINHDLFQPSGELWTWLPVLSKRSKEGEKGRLRLGVAALRDTLDTEPRAEHMYRFVGDQKLLSLIGGRQGKLQDVRNFRLMCHVACDSHITIEDQITARRACAASQDPRYRPIFHSLEGQAHALYVLGHAELERQNPVWRLLAWYMLSLAAGLGQLDAALLLHQLHKIDPKYTPGSESRDLIARAAEQRLDWRAMVAHSEYTISKLKSRRGPDWSKDVEFEQCLQMLAEAMRLTKPTQETKQRREPPPRGMIDAVTLSTFEPPYGLIIDLTAHDVLASTASDQVYEHFWFAATTGAELYNDCYAAWLYAQSEANRGHEFSDERAWHLELAASSGIPEAAFELAKYHFRKDGWYPSVAARVLEDARRRDAEYYYHSETAAGAPTVPDAEKHDQILALKDEKLLEKSEGLFWMKVAAELYANNPVKAVNRYFIAAGLLRQNGLLEEGRNLLLEAQEKLRENVGDPTKKRAALQNIAEYLQNWDTSMVHKLLDPEEVDPMLNP